jgi:chemotaxis methyl-accepting protein methylase
MFRNPPQLKLLSKLLASSSDDLCRIAIYGVADGSEAVSLLISLDPQRNRMNLKIEGFDICSEYLEHAKKFIFTDRHFPPNIKLGDFNNYLERDDRGWRLKLKWQPLIDYALGDVLQAGSNSSGDAYNLVMCQNLLISLPKQACETAVSNLITLAKSGGFLAIGGGPLGLIHSRLLQHGMEPILEDVEAIHEAWTVQRQFYHNPHPPYWALEPFDATNPEGAVRYCTLFRKPAKKT